MKMLFGSGLAADLWLPDGTEAVLTETVMSVVQRA
jgi:hypothetical protein